MLYGSALSETSRTSNSLTCDEAAEKTKIYRQMGQPKGRDGNEGKAGLG